MNIRTTVVTQHIDALPSVSGGPFPNDVTVDVTSPYGPREPFETPAGWTSDFHSGVDFYAPDPPPLVALTNGVVRYAYFDPGVGNWIRVDAGDGWTWDYYHMAAPALVGSGERVWAGQVVGLVGSTGYSTAPHLHLQIARDGTPVDPMPLLIEARPDPEPEDSVLVVALPLDKAIEKVQRFARNATDVLDNQDGDGMYEILSGFPDAKPGYEYVVLEMKKEA